MKAEYCKISKDIKPSFKLFIFISFLHLNYLVMLSTFLANKQCIQLYVVTDLFIFLPVDFFEACFFSKQTKKTEK